MTLAIEWNTDHRKQEERMDLDELVVKRQEVQEEWRGTVEGWGKDGQVQREAASLKVHRGLS